LRCLRSFVTVFRDRLGLLGGVIGLGGVANIRRKTSSIAASFPRFFVVVLVLVMSRIYTFGMPVSRGFSSI